MVSIILIGFSLAFDALAVSISSGISNRDLKTFHVVRGSFFFGAFQFIMPVTGWFLGKTFVVYIETFDHWIAFALLAFIGGKMLFSALPQKNKEKPTETNIDIQNIGSLFILAIATSIDALAVGLSFSMVNQDIWIPALIIGCMTFVLCFFGFEFGKKIGSAFENGSQIIGGLILIGIGIKILLEHIL
ncbi:manganese efflux pump MntP family protein [Treponema primitia]|uniref:manganese efflux pump MntP n=1 Tax=Treponema primitia TaxID=88058 RepID=UPI0002554C23|nr:manganese efflux pump MntP family protein [Treponema primitia]